MVLTNLGPDRPGAISSPRAVQRGALVMNTRPSVYYGTTTTDQLSLAAAEIDKHATSNVDGRCAACRLPGPCPRRETAVAIFSRYHRLPLVDCEPEWPQSPQ